MSRRHVDAAAHARFHAARTGEAEEPAIRFLTVGTPPRLVLDFCPRCDSHGPVTENGLCGECAAGEA